MIALKLTWIRKFKTRNHQWKNILTELYLFSDRLECYGPCFLSQCKTSFWTDNTFFSRIKPNSTTELLSKPVFYDENIKSGNKVIKHTKWIENGVYFIAKILSDNGQFFAIAEFNASFGLTVDFLMFSGCICPMKQYIKKLNIAVNDNNACHMNVALGKSLLLRLQYVE